MAASVVVAVRKWLVAGLADELATQPQVSVSYGWQGGSDDARREEIYTNRARATHEPASLKAGRTFRNERMQFDVIVRVLDPVNKPEDVDDRLMELVQVCEEWIADNKSGPTDGSIPGLNAIWVSAFELENRIGDTGSASLAQLTVTYDARLT